MVSVGTCTTCKAMLAKPAMAKHLESCPKRRDASGGTTRIIQLLVEGRYGPEYWTYLDAPATATLEDLDRVLRALWLECCGHLSAFTIERTSYALAPLDADEGMDVALGELLRPRMKFYYEYDFGTTTELALKVVSAREEKRRAKSIQIRARNEPPPIGCSSCGNAAVQVCADCLFQGKGWLCRACAKKHTCGEERLLPVVNSPRVGMCGYTG
jgi:hypothetical protein